MPYQHRRAESPRIDEGIEVRDVMARAVFPLLGPFAVAVAAQVHRESMEAVGEMRPDEIPPMPMGRAAMNEENRRLALAAIVDTIQRQAVDDEFTLGHAISDASRRCGLPSMHQIYQSVRTKPATTSRELTRLQPA